jgi:hypothetical protein
MDEPKDHFFDDVPDGPLPEDGLPDLSDLAKVPMDDERTAPSDVAVSPARTHLQSLEQLVREP